MKDWATPSPANFQRVGTQNFRLTMAKVTRSTCIGSRISSEMAEISSIDQCVLVTCWIDAAQIAQYENEKCVDAAWHDQNCPRLSEPASMKRLQPVGPICRFRHLNQSAMQSLRLMMPLCIQNVSSRHRLEHTGYKTDCSKGAWKGGR